VRFITALKDGAFSHSGGKVIINDITTEIKKEPTIIVGFASIGLLGTIITDSIIKQIPDMKEIGFIASDDLPPISVFYEGVLKHPFRLYHSSKHNLIVGTCEVQFTSSSNYNDVSMTLCNWALSEDVKAKELVVFQGIPKNDIIDDFPVFYAADNESMKLFEDNEIKRLNKGIVTGPEATLLNEAMANGLKTYALFTNVYSDIPTPEGAAAILDVLNDIYGLGIDIKDLIDQGKEIKSKLMDLAEKAQQQFQQQQAAGKLPNKGYANYFK